MSEQQILALADKLDEILRENIIDRYHNPEYWEPEIFGLFQQHNKLTAIDMKKVRDIIGG